MRNRTEVLRDLVRLQCSLEKLEAELSEFHWDSDVPLYSVTIKDLILVLNRVVNDDVSLATLVDWANAIECRDDLEFEKEITQELVFELANPEINGYATKERLQEMMSELQTQNST